MPDASGPGVIDAHVHIWDPQRHRHGWLSEPGMQQLDRVFDLARHRQASADGVAHRPIDQLVLVQTLADSDETVDLLALGAQDDRVAGVVGWVDLTSPDVADRIDELCSAPHGDQLIGIRHLAQQEPDSWFADTAVRQGLSHVAAAGLPYDLLIRTPQIDVAIDLVTARSDLTVVLDHAGKPSPDGLPAWRSGMARLARRPGVVVKISGLMTEIPGPGGGPPRYADVHPVLEVLLEEFGPDRLLFGSDWPVCLLAGGYHDWAGLIEQFLSPLTPAERDAILSGTARATYRLPHPAAEPSPSQEISC